MLKVTQGSNDEGVCNPFRLQAQFHSFLEIAADESATDQTRRI